MSFTASTVRRVFYEGGPARFLYAIGNTPARAVLPAGGEPLDGPIKVLGGGGLAAYCHASSCHM